MQVLEDHNFGEYTINAYAPDKIIINDQAYAKSLVLSSHQLVTDWPPRHFNELNQEHLQIILDLKPEVVLLSTGHEQQFAPPALLAPFFQRNIGVETMSTAAACRTFNVLASEGRNVVAGLIIEEKQ